MTDVHPLRRGRGGQDREIAELLTTAAREGVRDPLLRFLVRATLDSAGDATQPGQSPPGGISRPDTEEIDGNKIVAEGIKKKRMDYL